MEMDLIGGILALHLENGMEQSMPNWQCTLPDADRRRRPGSCFDARSAVNPKKLGVSCCCSPTVVEPNLQASKYNQFSLVVTVKQCAHAATGFQRNSSPS
jgi:hypothetical protein